MDNELNQLIPIVSYLADKYTSKESTSVSYETAQMLMEAVIYCINEYFNENPNQVLKIDCELSARAIYDEGYNLVVAKVHKAKALYDVLLQDFLENDFSQSNTKIFKELPKFFLRYDARFCPQNHVLSFAYPLIPDEPDLCGVDLIYKYLCTLTEQP